MVTKSNHPVIFGISWIAEFNPQIDWYNHSVKLDFDAKKYTVFAENTADSCYGIDLCTSD